MTTAFLNCIVWSVPSSQPYIEDNFYLVDSTYHHNSLEDKLHNFRYDSIQIPEFEIKNNYLLDELNYDIINKNSLPILKRVIENDNEHWTIDLKYYENYKLQHTNI